MNLHLPSAAPPGITPHLWQASALEILATTDSPAPLIHAVMGAGKSIAIVMLCRAFLAANQGASVVVSAPTETLVEQLATDLERFCGVGVGRFYGRKKDDEHQPIMVVCYPSVDTFAQTAPPTDLWICDEAHLSESPREKKAFDALKPAHRVAFTATPFRGDSKKLSLWDRQVFSYPIGDALRDKILVPWEVVQPRGQDSELLTTDLDQECLWMLNEHKPDGPGIIGAKSIEDAEAFSSFLCDHGWPSAPLHSQMSPKLQSEAFARLQSGQLKALVHVNILTTGVNIPWLCWGMFRRNYHSRTSFIQFFGRILRASPGKEKAIVFDPWHQLARFSIDYEADIGENPVSIADDEEDIEDDEADFLIDLPPKGKEGERIPKTTVQKAILAWCRAIHNAAQAQKVVAPAKWAKGGWRDVEASDSQLFWLRKWAWAVKHFPLGPVREGVGIILTQPERLPKGAASDLMDVLRGSIVLGKPYRDARQRWNWELLMPIPPLPKRVIEDFLFG